MRHETQCNLLLDTGATVNQLDQKTHDRIGAPKLTRGKNPNLLSYNIYTLYGLI